MNARNAINYIRLELNSRNNIIAMRHLKYSQRVREHYLYLFTIYLPGLLAALVASCSSQHFCAT